MMTLAEYKLRRKVKRAEEDQFLSLLSFSEHEGRHWLVIGSILFPAAPKSRGNWPHTC